uniref:Fe2OG dioxygenase domain-containing protein n=1 Tax=Oreochromis aureus TaxID=47969 RepID=A0A668TI81_OREAU
MAPVRQRNAKGANAAEIEKKIKRGNALRQGSSWRGSRLLVALLLVALSACGTATWLYVTSLDSDITETLVSQGELVSPQPRVYSVQCSEDYDNYKRYPGCTPQKCGRAVTDGVVTREEAQTLRRLAERGLALAGSEGGASILDLHSGALSMGKQFVNIYSLFPSRNRLQHHVQKSTQTIELTINLNDAGLCELSSPGSATRTNLIHHRRYFGEQLKDVFTQEDFQLYRDVRGRIQEVIAQTFGLDPALMYLTKPTFFSRINSTAAKTQHDEYWHPHIDKVTYGSFDYTSLLYLSDYGSDFTGGRFVFMDQNGNRTVEPRAGRVSFFSSGSENLHRVEKVTWGTRYAITVSFTCDPEHAISDPALPRGIHG